MPTYYEILDIPHDSSQKDIEEAYSSLALLYDSDEYDSQKPNAAVKAINSAYEVLSNPVKRREYDKNIGLKKTYGFPNNKTSSDTREDVPYANISSNNKNKSYLLKAFYGIDGAADSIISSISNVSDRRARNFLWALLDVLPLFGLFIMLMYILPIIILVNGPSNPGITDLLEKALNTIFVNFFLELIGALMFTISAYVNLKRIYNWITG